jgi:hypothetical protein
LGCSTRTFQEKTGRNGRDPDSDSGSEGRRVPQLEFLENALDASPATFALAEIMGPAKFQILMIDVAQPRGRERGDGEWLGVGPGRPRQHGTVVRSGAGGVRPGAGPRAGRGLPVTMTQMVTRPGRAGPQAGHHDRPTQRLGGGGGPAPELELRLSVSLRHVASSESGPAAAWRLRLTGNHHLRA